MNLVFDGAAHPLGVALHSLFALVPLAFWAHRCFVRKRGNSWLLLLTAAVIFFGTNGIVLWDQLRVREMVRSGQGLQVTRGIITQGWHIVSRNRDWTSSSLRYTTTVSEGFDVAGMRFRWNISDSYSPATFSNAGEPPLTFVEGTPVEVTWFVDAATRNDARIVRLRMGSAPGQAGAVAPGAAGIAARFGRALSTGDKSALAAMTRFPVAFAGHAVEQAQAETLWMALTMPALQSCLSTATPEAMKDGTQRAVCAGVTLIFGDEGGGDWRLRQVTQGP